MTRTTILATVVALILCAIIALVAFGAPLKDRSDRLTVGASLFPVADIVTQIGGEHVAVELILPPGASPHTFEPTPRSVVKLSRAATIFGIGHNLDIWAEQIANGADLPFITLDKNVELICGVDVHVHHDDHEHEDDHSEDEAHEHEEDAHGHADHEDDHDEEDEHDTDLPCDPHYWLSVHNAEGMAEQIADTLSELDPENANAYLTNLESYTAQLEELEDELTDIIEDAPSRDLVVFHDSWDYFAQELDLNIRGTFEASPGREPSAGERAELERTVSVYGITRVYSEPQLSDTVLTAFLSDVGVELGILDPIGGQEDRNSYIELMRYNAHAIQAHNN